MVGGCIYVGYIASQEAAGRGFQIMRFMMPVYALLGKQGLWLLIVLASCGMWAWAWKMWAELGKRRTA